MRKPHPQGDFLGPPAPPQRPKNIGSGIVSSRLFECVQNTVSLGVTEQGQKDSLEKLDLSPGMKQQPLPDASAARCPMSLGG